MATGVVCVLEEQSLTKPWLTANSSKLWPGSVPAVSRFQALSKKLHYASLITKGELVQNMLTEIPLNEMKF